MALVVKDRVKVYCSTTGTGDLSLGSAFAGFQTFNNALGDGDTTYYGIFESSTGEFEVGIGTFTSSGNTLSRDTVLESSNTGAKVNLTADTEVFITYPAEKSVYFDANGDVNLTRDPQSALQAATKQYVDTIAAAGIHYHDPVRVEQEGNLTVTYNNGTSGVGATLTNAGTQAALVIDGVTMVVNDRVLIYEQTDQTQNGIYTVTNVGSASTNWVLTRATDADSYGPSDPDALGQGDAFFVSEGDAGAGETYVMTTEGTITFGTTNIVFSQISATQVYSAGTGLSLSGTEFNVGAGTGITVDATTVNTAQDIATSATPTFDGLNTTGNITFGDNDKAIFGAGSDLQIYHDGSNSYISDQGTGNLRVLATNFNVKDATGTRDLFYAQDGGLTKIYYNGLDRIETTSTGIDVTGTVTADGLTVDKTDTATYSSTAVDDTLVITRKNSSGTNNQVVGIEFDVTQASGVTTGIAGISAVQPTNASSADLVFQTRNLGTIGERMRIDSGGDISFYDGSGNAKFFWDASAESLGIGTTSPSSYHANADNLVIQDSGNAGITIATTDSAYFSQINFADGTTGAQAYTGILRYAHSDNSLRIIVNTGEKMRIDGDGVLLVGKTSDVYSTEGTAIRGTTTGSKVTITRDGNNVIALNRLSSDGDIVNIARSGTLMGSITTEGSGAGLIFKARATNGYIGFHANNQTDGIFLDDVTTKRLAPYSTRDNEFDLGDSDRRWKDLYLSGSLSDGTTSRTVADIVGLTSSQFLRSDADDSASGDITFTESIQIQSGGGSANPIRIGNGFGSGGTATIHKYGAPLYLQFGNGQTSTDLYVGGGGTTANLRMQGGYIDNISSAYVQDYIYHQGDTDTFIQFGTDAFYVVAGNNTEITVTPTGVQLGDSGNGYFRPVSGSYGSIEIDGGAHNGWEGYSIGGRAVFMHDNGSRMGLYDDVNNEWGFIYDFNSGVQLFYNGVSKLQTTSTGVNVTGALTATTKSFVIDHPTKEGMKLRYGSLEGPEDGVYVRGRLTGETVIELPDYWTGLVHEDSITVQLTAMGGKADLWVESIADNKVTVGCDTEVDCFYFVQATRKDVDAWDVEYVADS